jgi:hypothetical protein
MSNVIASPKRTLPVNKSGVSMPPAAKTLPKINQSPTMPQKRHMSGSVNTNLGIFIFSCSALCAESIQPWFAVCQQDFTNIMIS